MSQSFSWVLLFCLLLLTVLAKETNDDVNGKVHSSIISPKHGDLQRDSQQLTVVATVTGGYRVWSQQRELVLCYSRSNDNSFNYNVDPEETVACQPLLHGINVCPMQPFSSSIIVSVTAWIERRLIANGTTTIAHTCCKSRVYLWEDPIVAVDALKDLIYKKEHAVPASVDELPLLYLHLGIALQQESKTQSYFSASLQRLKATAAFSRSLTLSTHALPVLHTFGPSMGSPLSIASLAQGHLEAMEEDVREERYANGFVDDMYQEETTVVKCNEDREIVLLSAYIQAVGAVKDDAYNQTVAAMQASLECYSRRHGYGLMFITHVNEGTLPYLHYIKIFGFKKVLREMPGAKWIIWLDADARVLDISFSLADFLQSHADNETHLFALRYPLETTRRAIEAASVSSKSRDFVVTNYAIGIRNSLKGRHFIDTWATVARVRYDAPYFDLVGFLYALTLLLREDKHGRHTAEFIRTTVLSMPDLSSDESEVRAPLQEFLQEMRKYNAKLGLQQDDGQYSRVGPILLVGDVSNIKSSGAHFHAEHPFDTMKDLIKSRQHERLNPSSTPLPLPFLLHSKYSLFCCACRHAWTPCSQQSAADHLSTDDINTFDEIYRDVLKNSCTSEEAMLLAPPQDAIKADERFSKWGESTWSQACLSIWGYHSAHFADILDRACTFQGKAVLNLQLFDSLKSTHPLEVPVLSTTRPVRDILLDVNSSLLPQFLEVCSEFSHRPHECATDLGLQLRNYVITEACQPKLYLPNQVGDGACSSLLAVEERKKEVTAAATAEALNEGDFTAELWQRVLHKVILPRRESAWNDYYSDVVSFLRRHHGHQSSGFRIVEVGTAYGGLSDKIAGELRNSNVYVVDPFLYDNECDGHGSCSGHDHMATQLDSIADSFGASPEELAQAWGHALLHDQSKRHGCRYHLLRLPSTSAAPAFEDGSVDAIFLDGLHTYEGVKADIQAWLPKLKSPGGSFIFNDAAHEAFPGVLRAMNELVASLSPQPTAYIGAFDTPPGVGNVALVLS
jgi:hypothetical protein